MEDKDEGWKFQIMDRVLEVCFKKFFVLHIRILNVKYFFHSCLSAYVHIGNVDTYLM
jgi:hypothetical protein